MWKPDGRGRSRVVLRTNQWVTITGSDNPRIKPTYAVKMRDQITESPIRSKNRVRATHNVGRMTIGHLLVGEPFRVHPHEIGELRLKQGIFSIAALTCLIETEQVAGSKADEL
jgi:hypothetical protein